MNERIRELATQARLLTGWPVGEVEYQKFAELILNQVFMCLENSTTTNKEYNKALFNLNKTLIEHFGVEK